MQIEKLGISPENVHAWKKYMFENNPYIGQSIQPANKRKNGSDNSLLGKKVNDFKEIIDAIRENRESEKASDFTWLFTENDKNVLKKKISEHPSLKYGVPAVISGNPKTADLYLGFLNPGVPKSPENIATTDTFTEEDKSKEILASSKSIRHYYENNYDEIRVMPKDSYKSGEYGNYLLDNFDHLEDNMSDFVYYNPQNIITTQFDRTSEYGITSKKLKCTIPFAAYMSHRHISRGDLVGDLAQEWDKCESNKEKNNLKKQQQDRWVEDGWNLDSMYDVDSYYNSLLAGPISEILRDDSISNLSDINYFNATSEDKDKQSQWQTLQSVFGTHFEKMNELKICSFELFPYRSANISGIPIEKLDTTKFSILFILNRIIDWLNGEATRPIIILRGYLAHWREVIRDVIRDIQDRNQGILPERFNLDYVEKFIWINSSPNSSVVSKGNMISLAQWHDLFPDKDVTSKNLKLLRSKLKDASENDFDQIEAVFDLRKIVNIKNS